MRCLLAFTLVWSSVHAQAGPAAEADRLVTEGAALGDQGDLTGAIERFKAAEAVYPRPLHDCNVALAYARMGLPHRAMFFIRRCQARYGGAEPTWVPGQAAELRSALQRGGFAPVIIETEPQGAMLTVSGFDADEHPISPVELWLPLGRQEVSAALAGHEAQTRRVDLETPSPSRVRIVLPKTPQIVSLVAPAVPQPPMEYVVPPPSEAEPPPPDRTMAVVLLAMGGAAAAGGGLAHGLAASAADEAGDAAPGSDTRQSLRESALSRQTTAFALYGVGALVVGVGLWLLFEDP